MRGGSEQLGLGQVVLLEGAYIEHASTWRFVAYQIGENVEIHFYRRSPNARVIPHLDMTRNQYENVFLPVVDSGVNNQPQLLRGINHRGFPGSWWNIATLEGRPNQESRTNRPNQESRTNGPNQEGGYKHRSHSHKRSGKSGHKRSGHKRRKSHTKKSCRRRH